MRDYIAAKNRLEDQILGRIAKNRPLTNARTDGRYSDRPDRPQPIRIKVYPENLRQFANSQQTTTPFFKPQTAVIVTTGNNCESMRLEASRDVCGDRARQPKDKGKKTVRRFTSLKDLVVA